MHELLDIHIFSSLQFSFSQQVPSEASLSGGLYILYMFIVALGPLQIRELLNTYYPIEIDAGRTAEDKLPLMVEW